MHNSRTSNICYANPAVGAHTLLKKPVQIDTIVR
ncbi:hypothetical protein M2281_002456 [Mesorhizobium soli]|nr:hypothetical protein [Mesorhizobium soli]